MGNWGTTVIGVQKVREHIDLELQFFNKMVMT